MIVIGIFLIFFMLVYMVCNRRNTITYRLALYYTILPIMLFIAVIYLSKVSSYKFPLAIDFKLYLLLSKIHIPITYLSRLYNLSMAIFMMIGIEMVRYFIKISWWKIVLLLIPLVGFVIWNDAFFAHCMNVTVSLAEGDRAIWLKRISNEIGNLNYIIVAVYAALPFYAIITYYFKTNLHVKKQDALLVACMLFSVDIFAYFLFINGMFESIFVSNVTMAKLPKHVARFDMFIVPVFFLLFILIGTAILIWRYKPFLQYSRFSLNEMIKNNQKMSESVCATLHTYKNAFLSIGYQIDLIKKNLKTCNIEMATKHADITEATVKKQITALETLLSHMSNIYYEYEKINILSCVEEAIISANIPENVKISKDYAGNPVVLGNQYHLTEAFVNLIKNAVEALISSKKEQLNLNIGIFSEDKLCVVDIKDNGCGISKESIKKIFTTFYTTKPRKTNTGVGLHYVQSVIYLHHGSLTVRSKKNEYTDVEIILPMCEA